jgi:hypothetical protein
MKQMSNKTVNLGIIAMVFVLGFLTIFVFIQIPSTRQLVPQSPLVNVEAGDSTSGLNPYYNLSYDYSNYVFIYSGEISDPSKTVAASFYEVTNSEDIIEQYFNVDSLYTNDGQSKVFYGEGSLYSVEGTFFLFKSGGIWYSNLGPMDTQTWSLQGFLDSIESVKD